jgi:hypothetical protein
MSRRPPGVFQDANGTWGYVFTSSHRRADGQRRQVRRRRFTTIAEATDALDEARREDTPGTAGTVGAVLDQFVRTKRLAGRAPATLAQCQWAAEQVKARWGGWRAEQLTAEHLDAAYLEMLAGGKRVHRRGKGSEATDRPMSARTVEVIHKTVKAPYQLAIDNGQLVRNPAALARRLSTSAARGGRRSRWAPSSPTWPSTAACRWRSSTCWSTLAAAAARSSGSAGATSTSRRARRPSRASWSSIPTTAG